MWRRDTSFGTAQATARGRAEALLNRDASNVKISLCAVMTLTSHHRQSDWRDHACASPHIGTYPSDSLQPGLGPVDPTSHSASHSGPGPLADTMVRIPHGSWRDDAARVVRSSLMSTEVSLATSLYATWIVLTSQPTIPAACRRPSRLCVQARARPAVPVGPAVGGASRSMRLGAGHAESLME